MKSGRPEKIVRTRPESALQISMKGLPSAAIFQACLNFISFLSSGRPSISKNTGPPTSK